MKTTLLKTNMRAQHFGYIECVKNRVEKRVFSISINNNSEK